MRTRRNKGLTNIAGILAQAMWESGGDAPWTGWNSYVSSPTASCTQREDGQLFSSLTSAIIAVLSTHRCK
eukprot:m.20428 g.20428  ORF g.20428 m.20428 type:complete len:70 (-) comp12143_c0_seq1:290-499(-)